MKKIFLPLLIMGFGLVAKAQPCVPGTLTVPQSGYVLPDSATNFNHACVGVPYEQLVYIKAPKDTVLGPIPATIDSFVINKNITGLPPGLTVESVPGFTLASPPNPKTNFDRLIIKGDSLACIKISGTVPAGTTPSVYNLIIPIRAYVKVSGLIALDTPANLSYYKIDVKGTPCWPASVNQIDNYGFEVNEIVPNPFYSNTELRFTSSHTEFYQIKVFNLLGQEIYAEKIKGYPGANAIKLDASSWSSGTYIYTLSNDRNSRTGKIQVTK